MVVVGLQLGAGPSGQPLVHWWVVVWLVCLGLVDVMSYKILST